MPVLLARHSRTKSASPISSASCAAALVRFDAFRPIALVDGPCDFSDFFGEPCQVGQWGPVFAAPVPGCPAFDLRLEHCQWRILMLVHSYLPFRPIVRQ